MAKIKIGEVCDIYDGPHATPTKIEKGPVYLGIDAITESGKLNPAGFNYLSEEDYKVWTKRVTPQYGDLVFSYEATLGRYALIPKGFYGCLGRRLAVVRPKDERINIKWLYYYFLSPEWGVFIANNTVKGSTVNRISIEDFPEFEISFLDRDEQDKIVEVLSCIDDRIDNNIKINDNLQQMAKNIYDYWFTQFDFPNEAGKPYRSSGGKMVWNEQLKREIPVEWDVSNFLHVAYWESNSQPPKSDFVYEPQEGYVRFIQNRDYDSDSHITYIPHTKNLSIVSRYDILMDKYGDAGVVRYGIEGAFNVALGKISTDKLNFQEYLRSFLESDGVYNYLHNSCIASTRASLSEANLEMLNIVIPTAEILEKYQTMLRKIRDIILKTKDDNQKLTELRDWLLPMLMNGQATIDD